MKANTATENTAASLALEFQKNLSNKSRKHGIIDHRKHKKCQGKKNGQTGSIMCNIINMSSISAGKYMVPQTSFLNSSFQGHTTNCIVYMGQLIIITCILIPKQDMEYVQYITSIVLVLCAPLFLANPRLKILHNINNLTINLSKIANFGLWQVPLKTVTF